jgi:putative holliday junction resolvase
LKKVLGLDVGEKRIGVALAEGKIVTAYGIVEVTTYQAAILEIAKICQSENVVKIVVGAPKHEDTFQIDKVRFFAMELAKTINLPIEYVDETLTSVEAERRLKKTKLDPRSKKYKQEVDKIAAELILEQYVQNN